MTTDKRGISALLLQRQLELRRYETAWMMLHKLRRAMVNTAREPLRMVRDGGCADRGGRMAGSATAGLSDKNVCRSSAKRRVCLGMVIPIGS